MNHGHIEHGEGAAKCVHRVVSTSKKRIEFVYPCEGRAQFGLPFTMTVSRGVLRSKAFRFGGLDSAARYVTAEQAARASETPAQRRARIQRGREEAASKFEREVSSFAHRFAEREQREFNERAKVIAESIRTHGVNRSRDDVARVFMDMSRLSARFVRETSGGWTGESRRVATPPPPARPWFVDALALPSWPCPARAVKSAFAALALRVHPDHGGTSAQFIEVKRARDEALRALEGRAV